MSPSHSSTILLLLSIGAPLSRAFIVSSRNTNISYRTNQHQHDTSGITGTQLYSSQSQSPSTDSNPCQNRRRFLTSSIISGVIAAGTSSAISLPAFANAGEGNDMTTQMFNEDGSLKEGAMNGLSAKEIEAKSKTVSVIFPSSSDSQNAIVNVDGNNLLPLDDSILSSSKLQTSYDIAEKWTAAPEYLDTLLASREKACEHITVFQVPGTFKDDSKLEKATTIGVAKALNFASAGQDVFPKTLASADIVGGRKVMKELSYGSGEKKQKYYEFDLAVAPETCGQSAENLNLGFCPYDTIVLVSATIVDEKMMVCTVTCNKDMWKRANADLKRVRGSFFVEAQA